MKKVLALVAIAVLTSTVATAAVNPANPTADAKMTAPDTRTNGTLGSLTISATQIGSLEVRIDASANTVGGDGVPFYGTTTGGSPVTLNDQVWLYAQIYDSPWQGGCTTWATPGPNWCAFNSEYFVNSPTAQNSFATSFTTTVPQPDTYQMFLLAAAGVTWPTPNYAWGFVSQSTDVGPAGTLYVDILPTPTPGGPTATPDFTGAVPVPTTSTLGLILMGALLVGVGLLVLRRSN